MHGARQGAIGAERAGTRSPPKGRHRGETRTHRAAPERVRLRLRAIARISHRRDKLATLTAGFVPAPVSCPRHETTPRFPLPRTSRRSLFFAAPTSDDWLECPLGAFRKLLYADAPSSGARIFARSKDHRFSLLWVGCEGHGRSLVLAAQLRAWEGCARAANRAWNVSDRANPRKDHCALTTRSKTHRFSSL